MELSHVPYYKMEMFILDNSDAVLRTRRQLAYEMKKLQDDESTNMEVHGIKFHITKHIEGIEEDTADIYNEDIDFYDIEIADDRLFLTDSEINALYDTMYNLLVQREDEDRLLDMHLETFEAVYLKEIGSRYLNDDEDQDFYKYVEDYIYEDVCYE